MSKPLVAYYRVSTREQGKSGLGIDAPRAPPSPGSPRPRGSRSSPSSPSSRRGRVQTPSTEDRSSPPHNGKATPVAVAKLDRLSRDVHFVRGLMAHKTPFLVRRSRARRLAILA